MILFVALPQRFCVTAQIVLLGKSDTNRVAGQRLHQRLLIAEAVYGAINTGESAVHFGGAADCVGADGEQVGLDRVGEGERIVRCQRLGNLVHRAG